MGLRLAVRSVKGRPEGRVVVVVVVVLAAVVEVGKGRAREVMLGCAVPGS